MAGVNKVILIGNLGGDPELKYTGSGTAVTTLSVATNETWKDESGNKQERTEWHRVVMWRRLAEVAGEYLRKGSKIYVEGRLRTRSWDDKDGVKRYTTEIMGDVMSMLDNRGEGGSDRPPGPPPQDDLNAPPAATQRKIDDEDDLPF